MGYLEKEHMKEYTIVIIVITGDDISSAPSLMSSRQLQKALGEVYVSTGWWW